MKVLIVLLKKVYLFFLIKNIYLIFNKNDLTYSLFCLKTYTCLALKVHFSLFKIDIDAGNKKTTILVAIYFSMIFLLLTTFFSINSESRAPRFCLTFKGCSLINLVQGPKLQLNIYWRKNVVSSTDRPLEGYIGCT